MSNSNFFVIIKLSLTL